MLTLSAALVGTGVTLLDPRTVGNLRVVYASSFIRAVVIPSLQQASAWEAAMAAPLLGVAEVLMLTALQPGWSLWWAGAVAAAWRLVAVCVSAAWERRSRWRFMQEQMGAAAGAMGSAEVGAHGAVSREEQKAGALGKRQHAGKLRAV